MYRLHRTSVADRFFLSGSESVVGATESNRTLQFSMRLLHVTEYSVFL